MNANPYAPPKGTAIRNAGRIEPSYFRIAALIGLSMWPVVFWTAIADAYQFCPPAHKAVLIGISLGLLSLNAFIQRGWSRVFVIVLSLVYGITVLSIAARPNTPEERLRLRERWKVQAEGESDESTPMMSDTVPSPAAAQG